MIPGKARPIASTGSPSASAFTSSACSAHQFIGRHRRGQIGAVALVIRIAERTSPATRFAFHHAQRDVLADDYADASRHVFTP